MQYIQEFSIKQGVVGSQTRVNLSFLGILGKLWSNRSWIGRVSNKKKLDFKMGYGEVTEDRERDSQCFKFKGNL